MTLFLAPERAVNTSPLVKPTRVQLESPFAGSNPTARGLNQLYLRAALRDSLLRGEAPFASHAIYAQQFVLDDESPAERALGIEAGLAFLQHAEKVVVYVDRGISSGMTQGIERAQELGIEIEERSLPEWKRG